MRAEAAPWVDAFSHLLDRRDALALPLPAISKPMRVVLVRHGESTWNAEGRLQGSSDESSLTERVSHQRPSADTGRTIRPSSGPQHMPATRVGVCDGTLLRLRLPLLSKGTRQAERTRDVVRVCDLGGSRSALASEIRADATLPQLATSHFDQLLYSPLKRASQTAEIVWSGRCAPPGPSLPGDDASRGESQVQNPVPTLAGSLGRSSRSPPCARSTCTSFRRVLENGLPPRRASCQTSVADGVTLVGLTPESPPPRVSSRSRARRSSGSSTSRGRRTPAAFS